MENSEKRYPPDILEKAKKIKLLILDVDGVLTDGALIYDNKGEVIKRFNVNDGLGVLLLKKAGIDSIIVTAMASQIVRRRAKCMQVREIYRNFHDKGSALEKIKRKHKIEDDEICFMGDDVIDIPILKKVGFASCPANAVDEVKKISHLVVNKTGGNGAVRELTDLILVAQGKKEDVLARYFK